ncbi:TRAP-T-associated universal stress protein TeaD [Rubrobacter xylanophilus DSM 9941]|uniref:universal stress protein n=1 Tax=Rubrobacter xylanophilus TaxID=49319 RepID=UPI001C64368D|nr:universal stress protein [Rubrobacter xylanophilus]QYJ17133.1 TRAP-T-associated universal stress protein TeaD [Rubrobacter xylanophilus DSM 9941]
MYGRVLVAVDWSRPSDDCVLEHGARLARRMGARMHVVSVLETPPSFQLVAQEVEWLPREGVGEYLEAVEERGRRVAEEVGVELGEVRVVRGNPAREILRYAEELGFDLVVLGRRGGGISHRFRLGSTVHRVVSCCNCSVVIVPPCVPVEELVPGRAGSGIGSRG